MTTNPLIELTELGQSIWYDNIERHLITSGELKRLIDEDQVRGVTSNPAIFEKAISGSDEYLDQLRELAAQKKSPVEIYEALAIRDIQMAADILKPVFEATDGQDGFVSLECSPLLAHDTDGTIQEARRLWAAVDRKNVMIKIPGTAAGIPAIEQCICDGININITLLFSLTAYEQTMEAYIRGLERRAAEGKPVNNIASVASFFVSRIDTVADKWIEGRANSSTADPMKFRAEQLSETRGFTAEDRKRLPTIAGRIAIANAKLAYQRFKAVFHGERFASMSGRGARVQRPLWASTSTKNPAYPDVYYVERLIGPETINTIPPATLKAFRDHGRARITIDENLDEEREVLALLHRAAINLDDITSHVLDEGVKLFVQPFEKLLQTISGRSAEIAGRPSAAQSVQN